MFVHDVFVALAGHEHRAQYPPGKHRREAEHRYHEPMGAEPVVGKRPAPASYHGSERKEHRKSEEAEDCMSDEDSLMGLPT